MIAGKIKQIETMGLMDGPGVRVVVFMQGCPLRCLFCHNPEMWSLEGGESYTPDDLINKVLKYKNYFGKNGGITFSGGEPLSQSEFLIECLKLCKEHGIHTCLDTSGVGDALYNKEIISNVDLIILDVKAVDEDSYFEITSVPIEKSIEFLNLCQSLNKKLWLRSVIVPNINDTEEYIKSLAEFILPLKNIEKIELLPYHTMGKSKYEKLGIPYKLSKTMPLDNEKLRILETKLNELLKTTVNV